MPSAIVVPGSSIGRTRTRLVREAERVARSARPDVVVFSGADEAEHMRSLWRGIPVELVVEENATSTVENAARTLPLLRERSVDDAIVVCAPAHLLRARWIFRRVYGHAGIRVRVHPARVVPTPGAVAWELAAATMARRQVGEVLERR
ncbi:MAG TPA: YdcF family protein [Gaiellaceae bacterium]|nr:YdcF family protein [Gaiellaceae bacterium]